MNQPRVWTKCHGFLISLFILESVWHCRLKIDFCLAGLVWPLGISKDEIELLSITFKGFACKGNHGLTFWLQPFTFKPLIARRMSESSDIYCLSDWFHNECLYEYPSNNDLLTFQSFTNINASMKCCSKMMWQWLSDHRLDSFLSW